MNFIVTEWHEKNPNDWCAIQSLVPRDPNQFKLIARHETLEGLIKIVGERSGFTFCRAWGHGISKDHPITN